MDNFSITREGKPLAESLYTIDLDARTFSTKEDNVVLNFPNGWTFNTGNFCTFKTGNSCTFKTFSSCTFKTTAICKFDTKDRCTFKTGYGCTFKTGECCTFMLWRINTCKFKTYDDISTILDCTDRKHYILTKELITMLKVTNG